MTNQRPICLSLLVKIWAMYCIYFTRIMSKKYFRLWILFHENASETMLMVSVPVFTHSEPDKFLPESKSHQPRGPLCIFNLLFPVEFTYILSNNLAGNSEQASLNEELLRHW